MKPLEIRAEMRLTLKMLQGISDIEYRIISTMMGKKLLNYVRKSWKRPSLAARWPHSRAEVIKALRRELVRLR